MLFLDHIPPFPRIIEMLHTLYYKICTLCQLELKTVDNPITRLFNMLSHGSLCLGFVTVFQA